MIKKIFLVHHTHMDIGYTDLPLEVMDQQLNHLDEALFLCKKDNDFFWTIESAYLVRDYMRNRPEACRNELIEALKQGKMELQAFEMQPLTELLSADELFRSVEFACHLGQKHGFQIKSAMINDIGGYAGGLPIVLNHYGIKYLTAGVGGFQAHLPFAKLPHLFYLKSKADARTLIWNLEIDRNTKPCKMIDLSAVYGMGAHYLIAPAMKEYFGLNDRGVEIDILQKNTEGQITAKKFADLMQRLKKENYPYTEIMLQYGGDNRGPLEILPDVVRKLNALGEFPEIKLTTPVHFFEYMEKNYGNIIPELQGAITDPWNMRANPAPVPLKKYRGAQRIYSQALARLALNDSDEFSDIVRQNNTAAEEYLQLYGDHTCGLSEWNWHEKFDSDGCRNAAYDRYRKSWAEKAFYADAALDGAIRAERMSRKYLVPTLAQGKTAIIVWNTSPVQTSGAVEIYLGRNAQALDGLKDKKGNDISFQEIGTNRYLLNVNDIPALGAKVLNPSFNSTGVKEKFAESDQIHDIFENDFFIIKLSLSDGDVLSITDKKSGKELLDLKSRWKFGAFIYQQLNDICMSSESAGMKPCKNSKFPKPEIMPPEIIYNGSIALNIRQKGQISGPSGLIRFYRDLILYYGYPRIDARIRIDKPETQHKESCYVAFPFAGENGEFKFDQNIGMINPEKDLLPGAMQDLFYCSRFVSVDNGNFNTLVCCPDAPLVQLGAVNTAQWLQQKTFKPQQNHIYGQIYHNILNTDCPIWQDILETFVYHIFLRPGKFDYATAQKDWATATALSAEYCKGSISTNSTSLNSFEIFPEQMRMLSLRKTGKKLQLILENPDDKKVQVKVTYKNKLIEFFINKSETAFLELPC